MLIQELNELQEVEDKKPIDGKEKNYINTYYIIYLLMWKTK